MLTTARSLPGRVLSRVGWFLAAGCAASASQALAQHVVVSPQLQLSPTSDEWFECSVGVSQTNKNEVLVMASPGPGLSPGLRVATVFWGLGLPTLSNTLDGVLDVYLAPHPSDGTIWYTALGNTGPVVGWKAAGDSVIPVSNEGQFSSGPLQDKPAIAIGAWPGAPTGYRYYVVRLKKSAGGGVCTDAHQFKISYSDNAYLGPGPLAWTWTEQVVEPDPVNLPGACHYLGWAPSPAVLDDGRIVIAARDQWKANTWRYNFGKPYVVYSDDGIDWKPDNPDDPNNIIRTDPAGTVFAPDIRDNCFNICPNTGCDDQDPTGAPCSTCGDTPMQIDRRKNAPSIAVDRSFTPNHVYVAFYAKPTATSSNTDLVIAKSIDGGETFPNSDLLHITDAMLGLTPDDYNPDQMVPALTIDSCGGVNVMFYDNRNDTNPNDCEYWADVYYARITNFDTTPSISQWRLTPQSVRVDNLGAEFLSDYHNITVLTDGQVLYAAYISRNNANPTTGNRTCYLHRINLNCTGPASDFTGDGEVTEADLAAYIAEYSTGSMAADLDLDWVVDVNDFVTYADWYNNEQRQ